MITTVFQRHLRGQTPLGVFTNWRVEPAPYYVAVQIGTWRLTVLWG